MIFDYFKYEYYEEIKPYVLIAYIYDKLSLDGFIKPTYYYNPLHEVKYDDIFDKSLNSEQYLKIIEELIVSRNLDRTFCEKLATSNSLRYLIAVGFHECPVVSDFLKDSSFSIILDCNGAFGQPKMNSSKIMVFFDGVCSFKEELFLNNEPIDIVHKKDVKSKYEFNRYLIRWTKNGRLFVQFQVDTYGEPLYSRYIEFDCSNIRITAVEE